MDRRSFMQKSAAAIPLVQAPARLSVRNIATTSGAASVSTIAAERASWTPPPLTPPSPRRGEGALRSVDYDNERVKPTSSVPK